MPSATNAQNKKPMTDAEIISIRFTSSPFKAHLSSDWSRALPVGMIVGHAPPDILIMYVV